MNYPTISTQIARHLVNGAQTDGGATINHLSKVPRSGYCVGLGGAVALDKSRPYFDQALEIVDQALNDQPRTTFGAWVDSEDRNALYIEPVQVFSDEGAALEAAAQRGELAIFDLDNGVEIRLNRVNCGHCGHAFSHAENAEELTCPACGYTSEPCDFPDVR